MEVNERMVSGFIIGVIFGALLYSLIKTNLVLETFVIIAGLLMALLFKLLRF
jgi:hypothetical protein